MKFRKTKFLAAIILCCGSVGFTAPADKAEGSLGSYDICYFEIKDGKVVNVSGSI